MSGERGEDVEDETASRCGAVEALCNDQNPDAAAA